MLPGLSRSLDLRLGNHLSCDDEPPGPMLYPLPLDRFLNVVSSKRFERGTGQDAQGLASLDSSRETVGQFADHQARDFEIERLSSPVLEFKAWSNPDPPGR
jgi:hypothetical protein